MKCRRPWMTYSTLNGRENFQSPIRPVTRRPRNGSDRGKLSIPDPTRHTTTAQFLRNLEKFKSDKWLDYVKALAKQKPILVESLAPVTTTIIKGEASVGITYIKYIKQYKGPVSYVPMDKYL